LVVGSHQGVPGSSPGARTKKQVPAPSLYVDEAEEVYRADIELWKDNMWGLLGLKLCLEAKGDDPEELAEVTALFNERSSRADIVPAKTCFCAQDALDKSCC